MPKDTKNTRTGTATGNAKASVATAQNGSGPQSSISPQPANRSAPSAKPTSRHAPAQSKVRSKLAAVVDQQDSRGVIKSLTPKRSQIGDPDAEDPLRRVGRKRRPVAELHRKLFTQAEHITAIWNKGYELAMAGDADMIKYYLDRAFGKPARSMNVTLRVPNPLVVMGLGPEDAAMLPVGRPMDADEDE